MNSSVLGEAYTTICDTMGQLMMYTDGQKIWNKDHEIMLGATNLGGNSSATQSGIIVSLPGSYDSIYVFSVDAGGGSGGLQYAIVDMMLNGGLGALVSSNNVLLTPSTEKITVIQHCNKKVFWVIAHEFNSSNFYTWELTKNGISANPTITTIGAYHGPNKSDAIGYMKASPKSDKFAISTGYLDGKIEIYDFDNETGLISNPIPVDIDELVRPYGIEFSPSGDLLYFAGAQNQPNVFIFQLDFTLSTSTEILASILIVGKGTSSTFGALQNAPDGRIYIAKDNSDYLSVINNPNQIGLGCEFLEDDFYLGGAKSAFGLPNLIPSFSVQEPTIELSENINFCDGTVDIRAISDIEGDSILYQWYFNNALITSQSSTQIQVDSSGEYQFKAIVYFDCQTSPSEYTQTIDISFPELLNIADIQLINPLCGVNNGSIIISESGGTAPYQYSLDNGVTYQVSNTFSSLESGIYEIVVQDNNGCMVSQTIELVTTKPPEIISVQITNTSCDLEDGALIISASNGTGQLEYSIDGQNFQQGNFFIGLSSGAYTITVIDSLGCIVKMTEEIETSTLPSVNLIQSNPTTCNQNNGSLEVSGHDGSPPYEYSIDGINFQTSRNFLNLMQGVYNLIIRDAEGCIDSIQLKVESEEPPSISNIEVTPTSCGESNGGFLIAVEGGTGYIQISLNGGSFQSGFSYDNLSSGEYDVQVIDEAECFIDTLIIINREECSIYIPNSFSPNNDGFNDLFKIYPRPDFKGSFKSFRVFNRWGAMVYETLNFNTKEVGWDGTYRGQDVGIGVYVFIVEYLSGGSTDIIRGNVTLIK